MDVFCPVMLASGLLWVLAGLQLQGFRGAKEQVVLTKGWFRPLDHTYICVTVLLFKVGKSIHCEAEPIDTA